MIDDATIKRVAMQHHDGDMGVGWRFDTTDALIEFARAIEQLARQEQREADAGVCHRFAFRGMSAEECEGAIRASGKENSNE